jgi:uncharacterized protein (TIGR03437 family)
LDENYSPVSASNPARRGHTIQVFLNGLGPVDRQLASGEPAPAGTLVRTFSNPTITIGGVPATVQFSGLAPGFPGLNQIDVVVPPNAPTGVQQLVVANGGVSAPAVNLPVE